MTTVVQQLQSTGIKAEAFPRQMGRARIEIEENGKEGIVKIDSGDTNGGFDYFHVIDRSPDRKQAVLRRYTNWGNREVDLLVGMDETHNFVAILPRRVFSVEDAHVSLRPRGITDRAKRQGEWFFEPLGENERRQGTIRGAKLGRTTKVGQKHSSFANGIEVRGKVTETRKGRHAPLDLGSEWHKPVRNEEVQADPNEFAGHRTFD